MTKTTSQQENADRGPRITLLLQTPDGQERPELPVRSLVLMDFGEHHADAAKTIAERLPRVIGTRGVDGLLEELRPVLRFEVPLVLDRFGDGPAEGERIATVEIEIRSLGDLEPERILEQASITCETYRELRLLKALRAEAGRRASAEAITHLVHERRQLAAASNSGDDR